MKKILKFTAVLMLFAFAAGVPAAFADVIVKETHTTTSGFGAPDTPIGDFFYLIGDVVEFPFNLLGNLF